MRVQKSIGGIDPSAFRAAYSWLLSWTGSEQMAQTFDDQTTSTALALIGQYGIDAEVISVMRAAEFAAVGDTEALAAWDDIIACVAAIEAGDLAARPIQ
jgi:hypothetical protein